MSVQVHGGDGVRVARALGLDPDTVLDLSASLNPIAPDVGAVLHRHLASLRRYPDATEARAVLAEALDVEPGRVLLTNGGAEAIALVAAELRQGWVEEPEFSLYRRHLPEVRPGPGPGPGPGAGPSQRRWRSNPHNPSGRLAALTEHATDRSMVWDEAFYALATGRWTSGAADRGAVVLGSLTKLFACPGIRLGYVLAGDELIERLAKRQSQWSVNAMALAVICELVPVADLPGWAAQVATLRQQLVHVLGRHGLEPEPSDANYVLVPGALGLRERLAPRGVIVRDCASFGLEGFARIAVPDASGLARLDAALGAALEEVAR